MEIYLMQHGLALSEEEDPERPLSSAGKVQIEKSAAAIRMMGLQFDVIIASTKKRSKQTAEIVAKVIEYHIESIVETETIKPSASPGSSLEFIGQFKQKNSVLIAGHLPSLAKIASMLLTQESEVAIQFENGGLCRIDVKTLPAHDGILRWYLTPEQLALISTAPHERIRVSL
ncbi:MAG: phosphohistidine phosphatase SixA [Kiritimatiellae bacterium]|nr:phosphohistidine phosphatase SixA [Verrucomicrobiota bacterium]MBU4366746.1 phosphohistidine phosphatase SixA [Verrucomicrobiota bacterium]MCG2658991.1 phosphohistidine phosphatase SixA [Kiritimatiellia bacterium]